jgi:hypothetical protein
MEGDVGPETPLLTTSLASSAWSPRTNGAASTSAASRPHCRTAISTSIWYPRAWSIGAQTAIPRRPPGASVRHSSRREATRSGKYMSANWLTTTSKLASSKGSEAASPSRHSIFGSVRAATASIPSLRSRPTPDLHARPAAGPPVRARRSHSQRPGPCRPSRCQWRQQPGSPTRQRSPARSRTRRPRQHPLRPASVQAQPSGSPQPVACRSRTYPTVSGRS